MTDRFSKPENSSRKNSYQKRHSSLEPEARARSKNQKQESEARTALESGDFATSIQGKESVRFTDPRQFFKIINSFCHSTLLPNKSLLTH